MCAFAKPAPIGFSDAEWKFLSEMNQDKVAVAIKIDSCIFEDGYRLFNKNEIQPTPIYSPKTERAWQAGIGNNKVDACEDYQRTLKTSQLQYA